jgi:hypothetical protein
MLGMPGDPSRRFPANPAKRPPNDNQEQQTNREFWASGVRAVNNHRGFGAWAEDVSRNPTDIHEILARQNQAVVG